MKFQLKSVAAGFLNTISGKNGSSKCFNFSLISVAKLRGFNISNLKSFPFEFENELNESFQITIYVATIGYYRDYIVSTEHGNKNESEYVECPYIAITVGDIMKAIYFQNRDNQQLVNNARVWGTITKSLKMESRDNDPYNTAGIFHGNGGVSLCEFSDDRVRRSCKKDSLLSIMSQKIYFWNPFISNNEEKERISATILKLLNFERIQDVLDNFLFGKSLNGNNYVETDRIQFDEPKSLVEIYDILKRTSNISWLKEINGIMNKPNNAELAAAADYPEYYFQNVDMIPKNFYLPTFAFRNLWFDEFDFDHNNDIGYLNSLINDIKYKNRPYNKLSQQDRRRDVILYGHRPGFCSKYCEWCTGKYQKPYKRNILKTELREQLEFFYDQYE
jgi:hypothetical protein